MKKRRKSENTNSSEWSENDAIDDNPTLLSGIILFLLCLMLVFSTIAYGAVNSWALGINTVFAGLIAVLWLTDSLFAGTFRLSTNALQLPLLGLILIGLIQLLPLRSLGFPSELLSIPATAALSLDPNTTRLAIVQFCIYLIFFAAALAFVNTQKRIQIVVFIVIIFSSLMAFFGIIQSLSGSDLIYGLREPLNFTPFASFLNRHHFAAFMEMTIGLTLSLLYGNSTKKDKRLLLIIAVILMGSGLVLTGSRGAILSLFGVVSFVTLLNLMNKNSDAADFETDSSIPKSYGKFILIGSNAALILALLGSVLFLGGDSWLMRGVGLTEQADFSTGRTHFWQAALQIIAANPIMGAGLNAFGVAFTKYDTWNGSLRVEHAHNDYLQIFADAGIFGFVCAVAFIFLLFRKGLKLAGQTADRFGRGVIIGALAGCFGILMHSFVDFPLRTSSNALFFLTLAVLATTSIRYPETSRK